MNARWIRTLVALGVLVTWTLPLLPWILRHLRRSRTSWIHD